MDQLKADDDDDLEEEKIRSCVTAEKNPFFIVPERGKRREVSSITRETFSFYFEKRRKNRLRKGLTIE